MKIVIAVVGVFFIYCLTLRAAECKARDERQVAPQQGETNVANFVRLVVMRLMWGVLSSIGYGQSLSNVFEGAFVPPGAEDDYDDYGGDDYVPDLF